MIFHWSIGVGGAVFEGSIQTPLVRAESGHDLRSVIQSACYPLQAWSIPSKVILNVTSQVGIGNSIVTNASAARRGPWIASGRHCRDLLRRPTAALYRWIGKQTTATPKRIRNKSDFWFRLIDCLSSSQIKIDSSSVMLPNIRTAIVTAKSQRPVNIGQPARSSVQIFQVFDIE